MGLTLVFYNNYTQNRCKNRNLYVFLMIFLQGKYMDINPSMSFTEILGVSDMY